MSDLTDIKCSRVTIDSHRWDVTFTFLDDKGEVLHTLVCSADSAFTDSSGIYFATKAEYDEDLASL